MRHHGIVGSAAAHQVNHKTHPFRGAHSPAHTAMPAPGVAPPEHRTPLVPLFAMETAAFRPALAPATNHRLATAAPDGEAAMATAKPTLPETPSR